MWFLLKPGAHPAIEAIRSSLQSERPEGPIRMTAANRQRACESRRVWPRPSPQLVFQGRNMPSRARRGDTMNESETRLAGARGHMRYYSKVPRPLSRTWDGPEALRTPKYHAPCCGLAAAEVTEPLRSAHIQRI